MDSHKVSTLIEITNDNIEEYLKDQYVGQPVTIKLDKLSDENKKKIDSNYLDISRSQRMYYDELLETIKHAPRLKKLVMRGINFTQDQQNKLESQNPHLEIIT